MESLAHIDTICLDKTGTITQGKMRVSDVKIFDEKVLPRSFNDMMVAFVNESDDNNATFKAISDYFKGNIKFEKQDSISFSSERKWSSISFKNEGTIVFGAPERLFEKSKKECPKEVENLQKMVKEF